MPQKRRSDTRKQQRKAEENRLRNSGVTSRMKTFTKQALTAIEQKNAEAIKPALLAALSEIDRAASKGVIHPNAAARKKSALQRRAAALLSQSSAASATS